MTSPEEHVLALILARLVKLLRQTSPNRDAQRAALHALVRYTNERSATVQVTDETLLVEGKPALEDLPFVPELALRLRDHGLAEIRIAHSAAPLDLIETLRMIAADPTEVSVSERLKQHEGLTVQVVEAVRKEAQSARRAIRVTDAIDSTAIPEIEETEQEPSDTISGFVPASAGAAFNQLLELTTGPQVPVTGDTADVKAHTPLAMAIENLEGQTNPDVLSKNLNAVAVGIGSAVRQQRVHEAIDAMVTVIDHEAHEAREDLRSRYAIAFERALTEGFVKAVIPFLLDELYARDVRRIVSRAGQNGTRVLLNYLVSAKTFAERRAFMAALKHIASGRKIVVSMLDHHQWYVVRNVADVVGELRIAEGVPALGRAVTHEDARVRRAGGIALAKIGTSETVRHLTRVIHDEDRAIRLEVLKHVAARGLASLVMPLVNMIKDEQDAEVIEECYRALGRIGTPNAVQALIEAGQPGGFLDRHSMGTRLAAVEGLSAAGGSAAKKALQSLARDRNKQVREAVTKGLQEIVVDQRPTGQNLASNTASGGVPAERPTKTAASGSWMAADRRMVS